MSPVRFAPLLLIDHEDGTWALYVRAASGWRLKIAGLRLWP